MRKGLRLKDGGGGQSGVRIRVVRPVSAKESQPVWLGELLGVARPGTESTVVSLDGGPSSIESRYGEALAVSGVVQKIVQAERDGVDAVISNCMADPAVEAAREAVSIPVIGPAETSMHIAAMLGHSFSVVTILDRLADLIRDHALRIGVARKLVSVRAVNMPVVELDDGDRLAKALTNQSTGAVKEGGAHVIILGCTGMAGLSKIVEEGLREEGIVDVPVIDPAVVTLKIAETLADIGLSHSKRSYPPPLERDFPGY